MRKRENQLPSSYHSDYFLSSCAGAKEFEFGVETNHAVFKYLFSISGEMEGKKILDIGCGRGEVVLSSVRRGAKYCLGVDFSQEAIDIAQKNLDCSQDVDKCKVNFICVDALECDLKERFDVIFIADVVEHMYDSQIKILLENMFKHLSAGGIIVIHTMPTREFIILGQYFKKMLYFFKRRPYEIITFEQQAQVTHVNLQSKNRLKSLLTPYQYRLWHDFAENSFLRIVMRRLGLAYFLSGNLWAIIKK